MTLNDYQQKALSTAQPTALNWEYLIHGICGEAGEIAEKRKKQIRDQTPMDREAVAKELGDVLWYLAVSAQHLGYSLSEVAQMNVDKLASRKARGKIGGSGDER
jgi:NTP pyrophosphatase (non-canonical NTP hydrolase)